MKTVLQTIYAIVQNTLAHLVMNQDCLNEPGLACVRLQILHGLYEDIDK